MQCKCSNLKAFSTSSNVSAWRRHQREVELGKVGGSKWLISSSIWLNFASLPIKVEGIIEKSFFLSHCSYFRLLEWANRRQMSRSQPKLSEPASLSPFFFFFFLGRGGGGGGGGGGRK